ncbi:MAG: hypothetical protein WCX32_03315 [Clostridia bacterium]|jgi:transcription termination factor Rho|nr:hypothetical protein [Clostridia bacterium]MDD4275486.1 hypothetical protein [Clostridia bacterium]
MDNKNFNPENLDTLSIFELRNLGRQLGVYSPTLYKKQELIDQIMQIINGDIAPHIRKTNQGRPPKSLISTPDIMEAFINKAGNNRKNYDYKSPMEFSYESVANYNADYKTKNFKQVLDQSDDSTVNGIVEIINSNLGFLHVDFIKSLSNGIYISPTLINKYNLRSGDVVTAKTNNLLKETSVADVLSVNQQNLKVDFECLEPVIPNKQIKFDDMPKDALITPVYYGQRILITSSEQSLNDQYINSLIKSAQNNEDAKIVYFGIDQPPEYITILNQYKNIETYCLQFSLSFEVRIRVATLVLEYCKRLCEQGKNVILFFNGLEKLVEAYSMLFQSQNNTSQISVNNYNLSNVYFSKAVYAIKKYFASGRSLKDFSLTIFAGIVIDENVNEDRIIKKELKSIASENLKIPSI